MADNDRMTDPRKCDGYLFDVCSDDHYMPLPFWPDMDLKKVKYDGPNLTDDHLTDIKIALGLSRDASDFLDKT